MRTNRFSLIVVGTLCLLFILGCSGGSSSPTEPEPPPQQFRKVGNAEESVPVNADWTGQVAGCESAVTWRGGGVDIPTGVGNTFVTYWKSVGTKYPKAACLGVVDKVEFEVDVVVGESSVGINSADRCGTDIPVGGRSPVRVTVSYCTTVDDSYITASFVRNRGLPNEERWGGGNSGILPIGCGTVTFNANGPQDAMTTSHIRAFLQLDEPEQDDHACAINWVE